MNENTGHDQDDRELTDDEIVAQERARTEALEYGEQHANDDGPELEDAPTLGGDDRDPDQHGNGGAMPAGPLP